MSKYSKKNRKKKREKNVYVKNKGSHSCYPEMKSFTLSGLVSP